VRVFFIGEPVIATLLESRNLSIVETNDRKEDEKPVKQVTIPK
jgi:hypothetical protein